MVPALFARCRLFQGVGMGKDDRPPSLDELGERLRVAREHQGARRQSKGTFSGGPGGMGGLGWALRIGVEMVSALAVGVGIGLLLDWWLDTGPWLLVVFFLLGAGAAILNVYRAAMGYGLAVGYRKPGETWDAKGAAAREAKDADAAMQPNGKQDER
jgi:ATP synthase protein I